MPSSRSRHRNKSRGKSRHHSTHSTARPPPSATGQRPPRTTSNPPSLLRRPGPHVKTPQEIHEDHEYVRKVLAYLEEPGLSPPVTQGCERRAGDPAVPEHISRLQRGSSRQSLATSLLQLGNSNGGALRKTAILNNSSLKSEFVAGAIPKSKVLDSFESSSPYKINIKSQQISIKESQAKLLKTNSQTVDIKVSTIVISETDPALNSISSSSSKSAAEIGAATPVNMDDMHAADGVSSLCALLASMGATKVTAEQVATVKQANLCVSKNEKKACKTEDVKEAKTALNCNAKVNGELNDKSVFAPKMLTTEHLGSKIKVREEVKNVKKVIQNKSTDKTSEDAQTNVNKLEEASLNGTIDAKQSSVAVQEKSKADLKRERRATQEAQRAAKEKSSQGTAPAKSTRDAVDSIVTANRTVTPKTAPKKSLTTAHGRKLKCHGKGNSTLPFVTHLKEPDYVSEEPLYYRDVHPVFEKITHEIYAGCITNSDSECVGFIHALFVFLADYWAEPGTDFERDLVNKLGPNINYMKHFGSYTPPMNSFMKLFREMLQRTAPSVAQAVTRAQHLPTRSSTATTAATGTTAELASASPGKSEAKAFTELPCVWSRAVHRALVLLREWILTFMKKTYEDSAPRIKQLVNSFLHDGDSVLVYGYSRPLMESLLYACYSEGLSLRVVVADRIRDGEGDLLLRQLAKKLPSSCSLSMVALSEAAEVMENVQKVVMPCHHVRMDGSTQGPAGHALLADLASGRSMPSLGMCYTYQYTDTELTGIADNQLGRPEQFLWGRQPITRKTSITSLRSATPFTVRPIPFNRTTPSRTTYSHLFHTTADHLLDNIHNNSPDTCSSNPLRGAEVLLRTGSYSVCGEGADLPPPPLTAGLPMCCLRYDVANTLAYAISDVYTVPPIAAPSIMGRFHKLLPPLS